MERRKFIKNTAGFGVAAHPLVKAFSNYALPLDLSMQELKLTGPRKPVFIYNDWSSYDELSDNIPLTEEGNEQ